MPDDRTDANPTLGLSTKLEEEFIGPLTAVRGALEILRDYPDLPAADRARFVSTALQACSRLETGVTELAANVYTAGNRALDEAQATAPEPDPSREYARRIHFAGERATVEVDFRDFEFSSSRIVKEFYDLLEEQIHASGRSWYFLVDYTRCSVWPEAWVAFAHRGKKINVNFSLGTVRFCENGANSGDPDMLPSRERALALIESMRA